jgi:hypothetical protein
MATTGPPLSPEAALELVVILPNDGLPEPLLALPLSLPIGWKHSPPYFCAFTESCADMANQTTSLAYTHPFHYAAASQPHITPPMAPFSPTTVFPFQPLPPLRSFGFH